MTAKKKIIDKNGVQVFPITHTRAVLDDNGNSVEQRLQENLDLINQKQLEVGAVPSDVAPTAGSTNWVTSGGVFDALKNQVYDSVVDNVVSPNLFDKTKIIKNKYVRYDNGKATSSSGSGYFCTDYIPIDSEGAYAALGVTSGYRGFACYSDKSESAYTHGAVSSDKQAVYQEGDAYVRYTGKLEDVDRFMVVKGTSADYPSAYLPFGNIGELKASTVGNSQIQDSAVDHSKLATESVNEVNLSEQYWIDGRSIYGDIVKEVFFLDKAIPEGVSLKGHFYDGRVIFTASLNGTTIWTIDRQFAYNYFYNNVVYPLRCSTSSIETIAVGDVVGYIVFADIDTAKSIVDGVNRTVNLARVKYLLNNPTIATQTYNIKGSEIVTGMIADDAVSFDKVGFTAIAVISKNFLNEDDPGFKHEQGYYVRWDDGSTGYSPISTAPNGRTGYIPVSSKGLYFNAYVFGGVYGGAVYDKNKVYRRSTGAHYVYQEGDGYVRWTLAANPISPYTAGQYMVWEGDSSVMPEYDEYAAKDVIDPDVLPPSEAAVQDGSITEAKLSTEVRNSIAGTGVEICIPDEIPCVVGDTLRIYFRSIVKAPNPYIWDITAVSAVGKSYPRYYEYKPTTAGNKSVTFYVRNAKRGIIAQKTITIRGIAHMTSPATNKNILMLGASMLQDGTITYELNRRLTSNTGDGTPYNPTGLGLSNITFVGRKTGLSYPSIHLEHNSGWSWYDYATIGRFAYRFFVVGQAGIDVQPGAIYSGAGTLKFTVSQTDIDIDRETGTGYFTCTYSGSGTQSASGTLTLFEGEGDATITYDSFTLDSGNPFWNDTTQSLDFISYANNYCNGSIDILLCFFGMNDFTAVGESGISGRIENYVKPFIRAFHEQFPNNIFVICTLYLGSVNGGMAASYGASSTWNYYTAARKTWKWSELVRELAADEEFSSYVKIIDTNSSFDCENLYPIGNRTVANRSEDTEVVQTNGVHTTANGKKAIADGMYEGLNLILQ
jgi:hypothetical protein